MALLHVVQPGSGVGQRDRPVDERRELPRVDEIGDGEQVLARPVARQWPEPLAHQTVDGDHAQDRSDRAEHVARCAAGVVHQRARGGQRAAQSAQRLVSHVVEDDVVPLLPVGEVGSRVVHDVRGAERADELDVGGAGHPGDLRAQCDRDLDGDVADPARCAVDQDPLARLHLPDVADRTQRRLPRHRNGRRVLEREPCRLGHHPVSGGAGVLGERAVEPTEHFVAGS
jgi:hypothetical protein